MLPLLLSFEMPVIVGHLRNEHMDRRSGSLNVGVLQCEP
jgi:hypothetical protein